MCSIYSCFMTMLSFNRNSCNLRFLKIKFIFYLFMFQKLPRFLLYAYTYWRVRMDTPNFDGYFQYFRDSFFFQISVFSAFFTVLGIILFYFLLLNLILSLNRFVLFQQIHHLILRRAAAEAMRVHYQKMFEVVDKINFHFVDIYKIFILAVVLD